MRRFLQLLGIVLVLGLAPRGFAADAEVPHIVGDVTPDAAVVWARLPGPGAVTLVYRSRGSAEALARSEADAADDYTVRFELSRLTAGTRYAYSLRFVPAGGAARYVAEGAFTTAPLPNARVPVRLAWSADLAGQNVCRDATRGFPVFTPLLARDPDLFVAAGDMIYADGHCRGKGRLANDQVAGPMGPSRDLDAFRSHWHYTREDAAFRRFLAAVSYFPTWDDHEVMNNFGPTEDRAPATADAPAVSLMPLGLAAFLEQNPIRRHPGEPSRIYRSVRWGRHLHVFILDTRQYRAPATQADDAALPKSMLGDAQREWLLRQASASDATWQVIVSSTPLVIPTGPPEARDGWASGGSGTGYSRELRRLIDDLRAAGVVNVIWLSGDVHFATFFRHQIDEGYEIFEAVAGPLNAKVLPNPVFDEDLGSERLFMHPSRGDMTDFAAATGWFNFGLIEVDAQGQAVVRYVDANGRDLWSVALPPRRRP
jgi:alkaline phosphatase D